MKPVKSLLPASRWLLRISVLLYTVLIYGNTILAMQYQTKPFFIAAGMVLFAVLLFAGGFTSKPALTVVSALLMLLLGLYVFYLHFVPAINQGQAIKLLLLSVSLYFVSSGNK